MVHKIKILKFIIMFVLMLLMAVFSFLAKGNVETNLMKTILPSKIVNSTSIVPMADKYSSVIKVVFESDNMSNLEDLKKSFISSMDKTYFDVSGTDFSGLIDKYLSNPANFLSEKNRKLLREKKYDEIYAQSLNNLYNPAGIQLTSIEKDPYLFLDDFILSIRKNQEGSSYFDGRYYDFMNIKMKAKDGLSPDLSNKKIAEIIDIQKELSVKNSRIYLAGTPIHSYYTSIKSMVSINIICLLSTLLIIFLTYFYFRSVKMLIPIALSIIFGMLAGYTATRLWFNDFQIITMVFSTTLIGIGIDYSYHYCFAGKIDKIFIKNLSLGLLTTIIPFILLYLTNIELLKQISIYTIFGLCAIYLFIIIFYPCFNLNKAKKSLNFQPKYYKILFIILLIAGLTGLIRINFNNSLTALYMPSKRLLNAENLYNKVSGNFTGETQFITIKGSDIENILEKEEEITANLTRNNIEYFSLSKILPSGKRQRENFNLVKTLYETEPDNYSDILTDAQRLALRNMVFKPVSFDKKDYPYLSDFLLPDNTSFIISYTNKNIQLNEKSVQTVNIKRDVEKYMKSYSNTLLKIFPVVIVLLTCLFMFIYGVKKGLKLLIPPFTGVILSAGLTCLAGIELNLFSIIALFMILGFTIDYSIFRAQNDKQTEDAVFASSLTTSFSFLLLSFCGFKLLSSISLILFWGTASAYITGYLLFLNKQSNSMVQLTHEKN